MPSSVRSSRLKMQHSTSLSAWTLALRTGSPSITISPNVIPAESVATRALPPDGRSIVMLTFALQKQIDALANVTGPDNRLAGRETHSSRHRLQSGYGGGVQPLAQFVSGHRYASTIGEAQCQPAEQPVLTPLKGRSPCRGTARSLPPRLQSAVQRLRPIPGSRPVYDSAMIFPAPSRLRSRSRIIATPPSSIRPCA